MFVEKEFLPKMDLKSDDIFNVDIDPTILLGYELEKLNLANQLDVESTLLSVEDNKISETTDCSKDPKTQDINTPVTNVALAEELTPEAELEIKKDINGNEESPPEENLNELFLELELSDSDNEAEGEEESSILRERAPVGRHERRRQNRPNYLERNRRYDRSQFPPGSLEFLAGATVVHSTDTLTPVNQFTFQSNQSSVLNIRETVLTLPSSNSVSSPYPVASEDLRARSVSSPESGYESSITGSPPGITLSVSVSPSLDLIPENDDDDLNIIDYLVEKDAECALTGHDVRKSETDDRDHEGEIIKLINYLKDLPNESNDSADALESSCNSRDYVPLVNNSQDTNTYSGKLSPCLRNVEMPIRIDFKLECKAKKALREFLSDDEFYAAEDRIYRQIYEDRANNREVKIIHVVDEIDGTSENRTNLHHAVLQSNIEEIYCLVEIQKQYKKPLSDINIRDKQKKTALDYAVEKKMTLVVDYLKENTATQSVSI